MIRLCFNAELFLRWLREGEPCKSLLSPRCNRECRTVLATPASTVLKPNSVLSLPVKWITFSLANLKATVESVLKLWFHCHQEAFVRSLFPEFLAVSNGVDLKLWQVAWCRWSLRRLLLSSALMILFKAFQFADAWLGVRPVNHCIHTLGTSEVTPLACGSLRALLQENCLKKKWNINLGSIQPLQNSLLQNKYL